MTQHRHIAPQGPVPSDWFNTLQEFISTLISANFAVSIFNNTTLQVAAGTGNDQVGIGIMGRWRYISAAAQAAAPGGLTVGENPIFVCASDNAFVSNGAGNVETDNTVYAFTLVVLPSGSTPSGTGAQTLYRQVGTVTWDGSKFTRVTQTVGGAPLTLASTSILYAGADLASQAALPVTAEYHNVTGTTTITSIAPTFTPAKGQPLTLCFQAGITVNHANNIKLTDATNATFLAGDQLELEFDGTNWVEHSRSRRRPIPFVSLATFATLTPYDGMEVYLQVDTSGADTSIWHLRYNAGSSNTDKWEPVGGNPMEAVSGDTGMTIGTPGYNTTITSTAIFSLPRPGVYRIEAIVAYQGSNVNANTGGNASTSIVAGATPTVVDTASGTSHDYTTGQGFFAGRLGLAGRYAGAANDQIKLRGSSGGAYTVAYSPILLRVTPLRIS